MWRGERRIRVLVVDDEAPFGQALAKRLEKRGAVVTHVEGALGAMESLSKESVDVVLLDVMMPDMDGLTALEKIRSQHPHTEVIMLTGRASIEDGVRGIKSGAFDYLTKPLEIESLVVKIRQAFDKIRQEDEREKEKEFRARMEKRLVVAQRLASLGTLSAGVAHEINNPLTIIAESAGWLKDRAAKDESMSHKMRGSVELAIEKIEANVKRTKRITHQLLDFARQSDFRIQEFELVDLVKEVIDLTRKIAVEAKAEVKASYGEAEMKMWCDPHQVRQVLVNLVTNGLQAVSQGGIVNLSVTAGDNEIVAVVQDNGPGIPQENLERIFEPFFSTKPPGQGTGLGLSVSRGLVEKMGGRLEVESRLGYGASFRMVLPKKPKNDPM